VPQSRFDRRGVVKSSVGGSDFNSDAFTKCLPLAPAGGERGCMVDREFYSANELIALFRLFLEPSHVRVDKWSMSVNSTRVESDPFVVKPFVDRSRTYTCGDLFESDYLPVIEATLGALPAFQGKTCDDLQKASLKTFTTAIDKNAGFFERR